MTELLTTEEAAKVLLLAPQTLARYRSEGRIDLPFVKIGRRVAYTRAAIEQFIESRTRTSTSARE
jgi:excisionase family DNA binding protein